MPVLNNAQVATLQKALAAMNNVLPRIEMLEAMAQVNPHLQSRVKDLRAQREYLAQFAQTTLEVERQLGGSIAVPQVNPSTGLVVQPQSYSTYAPKLGEAGYIPTEFGTPVELEPQWNPAEPVPMGTTRMVRRIAPTQGYVSPHAEEQKAAEQYGWQLVVIHGQQIRAVKQ